MQQAMRNRLPIPEKIANAPELLPGLELYFEGFKALTSCRNAAYMSEGPIPWTAMRDYCTEYGFDGEQREYFYHLIAVMDLVYLKHKTAKLATK